MHSRRLCTHAFTLVEMALVLIIIGLLVGGILTGQELIRSAEIGRATKQLDGYVLATHVFRDKYNGLPGDLNPAAFGFQADANITPNHNGLIETTSDVGNAYNNEAAVYFLHLYQANLLNGVIPATAFDAASINDLTQYTPTFEIRPGGQVMLRASADIHYLYAGPMNVNAGQLFIPANKGITPMDASRLDVKMDDGNPQRGKLVAMADLHTLTSGTPADGICAYSGAYNTGTVARQRASVCTVRFRADF